MQIDDWYEHARRDAVRRGLPDLEPLLDMLSRATRALRAADWARGGDTGAAGGGAGGEDAGATGEDAGGAEPPPARRVRER